MSLGKIELWDAYDKDMNKTGDILVRGKEIPNGLYHLACEVIVKHIDGTYLITKRDLNKSVWPGYWEIGSGGSALKGESSIDCITRELEEETGISLKNLVKHNETDNNYFKEIDYRILEKDKTLFFTFLCITDIDKNKIVLQEGETIAYEWLTNKEILEFVRSKKAIPKQVERCEKYLEKLY